MNEVISAGARVIEQDDEDILLPRRHPWRAPAILLVLSGLALYWFTLRFTDYNETYSLIWMVLPAVFLGPLISGLRRQIGFDRVAAFAAAYGVLSGVTYAAVLGAVDQLPVLDILVEGLAIGFAFSLGLAPIAIAGGVLGCKIASWRAADDEDSEIAAL